MIANPIQLESLATVIDRRYNLQPATVIDRRLYIENLVRFFRRE